MARTSAREVIRQGVSTSRTLMSQQEILTKTDRVRFSVDDFRALMSVVWMILLYPNVHRYTREQRETITRHVYRTLFARKKPLLQDQDHMVIYRGIGGHGLI